MAGNIKTQRVVTRAELRRAGRRRVASAAIVGSTSFVVGIVLVAILHAPVSDDGSTPAPEISGGTPIEAAPTPVAAPTRLPEAVPSVEVAPTVTPPAEAPKVAEAPTVAEAPKAAEAPTVVEAPSAPWWERARGRHCTIDFGAHPRLILREGSLRKDTKSTYGPFVDAPILLRVRQGRNPWIVPHFYGFHPRGGKPALVYGTVHQRGESVEGVLPLKIGDDFLELSPEL